EKEVAKDASAMKMAAAAPANSAVAATNKAPSFEVKGYEITGKTLFSYDQLEPIFKKYVGPSMAIESVRQALADFQMAYRQRGFVTVAVALPQQQLTNGIVKVKVTEGKLTEINVLNNGYYNSNNVMRALPSLRTNIMLNSLVFQQELDRANANKDRQIYPVIRPGPEPGTSALDLKVKDRFPLHERFDLNNDSTPGTPELRMNLAAQYNNLWQYDHQVGLQYSFTPEELKDASQMPRFFDQPLIANYSGFYRMPLNFTQTREGRDFKVSDFGYDEASRRFRPPPMGESSELLFYGSRSTSDTGFGLQSESITQPSDFGTKGGLQITDRIFSETLSINENVGVRFNQPLPDIWEIHQSLSFGLDYKRYQSTSLQNRSFQAVIYIPLPDDGTGVPKFQKLPSPPQQQSRSVQSHVDYLPLALNYSARVTDRMGFSSFSFNNTFNWDAVFNNRDDFRHVGGSSQANGTFYVANLGFVREQKVFGDEIGILFNANGQWANQPLISNEQFGIGGRAGVRGYREGQEYGDTGWRVLFEPHTRFYNLGLVDGKAPMYVRGFAFMDYGERYLLDAPARGRRGALSLWGTGLGFNGAIGELIEFRATLGIPLKAVPGVAAYSPRITFGLGAQF
ncbi:MAG: Hemolysin activation/secretion protein-like protein, partial [Verrucomicrobiales bacterium]|nr:Hemolysin activation/secretion protein-like protein [Verrucomicrobiales bacterium]